MTKKPVRLDIKPSDDLRYAIDLWRTRAFDPPVARAEAARRLIEYALHALKAPYERKSAMKCRKLPLMRIRIATTDPDTGAPTAWRVISGNGPMLHTHGQFMSREEAVKFVLDRLRIGTAAPPGAATHGA